MASDLHEALARFNVLPDDAVLPSRVTGIILGVSLAECGRHRPRSVAQGCHSGNWGRPMKPRKDKGRIEGPFIPMLIGTRKSAAWRAMSPYAREVYITLKSRYGFEARNNGRIYVSTRDAAEETGFNKDTIARALRELSYYGFIVMTEPGCLGVEGRGKAPHWRLTELGYRADPPTRDFLRWDGELFREQKSPQHYTRKKRNPVRPHRTDCPAAPDIPVSDHTGQPAAELSGRVGRTNGHACPAPSDISRVNHSLVSDPQILAAQRQRLNDLSARLARFAPKPEGRITRTEISNAD
jgi:hypothetical protein